MRLLTALLPAALAASTAASAAAQQVSFTRDVLPILSDRCFTCHGPDGNARKADLRLDQRLSGALAHELAARVSSSDAEHRMPPADSKLSLSAPEIATLRRWVDAGAEWERHWSFVAPAEPELPIVAAASWPRSDLDRFVLARLEASGLRPAPAADPAALLRRLTLDLTGVPPTPAELDAFLADASDAAYERTVDRLLRSPRYGERMAWPWLQASRYADTDGYQADPTRVAWPWRDWLVNALNTNMPFDRFTIETLAGDLLPAATGEQRLATGLLRNNAHNGEGGRIAEETRIENVFDRTEMVATAWMGLTFECARCHDHKFDPIAQRDYYRLFAFFDQTSETGGGRSGGVLAPSMRYVADREARGRLIALEAELRGVDVALFGEDPALDADQDVWARGEAAALRQAAESIQPAGLGAWLRSDRFHPQDGGAGAMFGTVYAPEQQRQVREGPGWRRDREIVDGQVWSLGDGQFTDYFHRLIEAPTQRRMTLSLGSDDAIKVWCNGELVLQNDIRRGAAPDQERVELRLRPGRNDLLIKIVNTGGAGGFYCRRVDETAGDLPGAVARALLRSPDDRDDGDRRALLAHYRRAHADGWALREGDRQRLVAARDEIARAGMQVSVMDRLPPDRQRTTRMLGRGNYLTPGDAVSAGVPAALPSLPLEKGGTPDRLALARWLVSAEHPLTARVAVNRAWQTFFGRGLVRTSEDFGRQGSRPSHPLLLDWLARRFVESGWDGKALHRRIVMSATYRQSAAAGADGWRDDPGNVLLARGARHRLPAWMLRDQALALGGQLVERLGGPPVRPYQPEGIWAEATFDTIRYQRDRGDALYRRSLYVFWRRIVGPTVFFDTSPRQHCVVGESRTNSPLHALTTLNETAFVEAARGFAARACRQGGDTPAGRIEWAFRAATARRPDMAELLQLRERWRRSHAAFRADPAAAVAFLGVGDSQPAADVPAAELAAYAVVASILLNLDEVLNQ